MKPKPAPKEGPITKALIEAVALRRQLLDDGTPAYEADRIVGQGLKAVLGNSRPETWRFYCPTCKDTGWVNVDPSEQEQARLVRMYGENPQHAGYAVKCDPCKWTQMEREKRRKQSGQDFDPDDDLAAAGQTKQSRGFKRFGK